MDDKPTRSQMVGDLRLARSQALYYKGSCERLTEQMERMEASLQRSLADERLQNARLRIEMDQMRAEMANLRSEMAGLRAENRNLREINQELQVGGNEWHVEGAGAVFGNPIPGSPASSCSIPSECNCPNCAPHLYTPSNRSTDSGCDSPSSPTVCPVCCYHVRRR